MAEEDTQAKLAEMENQMTNMFNMMAEMKAFMMATRGASQFTPAELTNGEGSGKDVPQDSTRGKNAVEDINTKATTLVEDGVSSQTAKKEISGLKDEKEMKRLAKIEECLATQGFELQSYDKISPYAKVHVPDNYQEPEFLTKYDGTSCPKTHLRYYLRKMARYSDNIPLMIHTFQDSLQGSALTWYISLDIEDFDKWEDLANEFMRQYKFNIDVLPSREDLVHIEKRRTENLRTFVQRWKAVATQVKPPIHEDELMDLFLRTLPAEFYDEMYTSDCQTFARLVKLGEKVERRMKEKKAAEGQPRRQYPARGGKPPVNEIALIPDPSMNPAPASRPSGQTWGTSKASEPKRKFTPRQFSLLPRPLSQLLPMLLEGHLVAKEVPRNNPPRFVGFDETKTCDYHMGERGHNVDNCLTLKIKVQNLIDRGMLNFKEPEPNVHQNPLPEHQGVNMIEDDNSDDEYEAWKEHRRKADRKFVDEAIANGEAVAPLGEDNGRYRFMVRFTPSSWSRDPNLVVVPDGWGGLDDLEEFDVETSNDTPMPEVGLEAEFDDKLKIESNMQSKENKEEMDDKYRSDGDNTDVNDESLNDKNDDCVAMLTPFVIQLKNEGGPDSHDRTQKPMTIVLTDGMTKLALEKEEKVQAHVIELPPKKLFDSRAMPWEYATGGVSAITRSGRCYAPKQGEVEKKPVTEEDVKQVHSLIRTSEFEVIEQLRKMPAQVSLLELFKSSEKHKNALMKVLNEVHVPETINENQLEDFIGAILLKDQIMFSDEDFPEEGRSHNKALYIAVKSYGKEVPRVLVDNGSAFNLCPLNTLNYLEKGKMLRTSKASIRAFDGMKKEVLGEVELEVTIGPTVFLINCQVLDIKSSFNLLLGRPWIHTAGAVPSSLHQKLKFDVEGKTITVHGEVDFIANWADDLPCVKPIATEEADYHSLELVHMVHTPAGTKMRSPELSKSSVMSGKVLMENGYEPGKGLGKHAQGITKPIIMSSPVARGGVGFKGESAWPNNPRGCGRRRSRGNRAINPSTWKGKAKEVKFHEIPLEYTFPGPSKWLHEEDIYAPAEEDLLALFGEDMVNVVITESGDPLALE